MRQPIKQYITTTNPSFNASPGEFVEVHMLFVGVASLPGLLRAPGGLVGGLRLVPWYLLAVMAMLRVQAAVWVGEAVQRAPNPGFAKMVVNLNTVRLI